MDQQKVDMFISMHGNKFRSEQLMQITNALKGLDDSKNQLLLSTEFKDPTTMLLISLLAGGFGIDRFMLGDTGLGVAKLLTLGCCGVWSIIDLFSIQNKTKDFNYQRLMSVIS